MALGLCAALSLSSAAALAQPDAYPDKPIRIVVGFAPGGFTDVLARLLAQKLSTSLKQPVIVDNKPGATGTIGADMVAKSKADGYTLLLAHFGSNSVAPALYPKLPYDVIRDFTPIALVASTPMVLAVNPSVPVNDLAGFIDYVKKKPGALSYASSGSGTAQHLAAVQFMQATRTQMVHVPYKGSGAAMSDLLGGQVNLSFDSPPNLLPHIKSGKLKALAITSLERSALLPSVPTMDEAGLPRFEVSQWFAVMGPAHMPKDMLARLNHEINAALQQPDVVDKLKGLGGDILGGTPEQFATFLKADSQKWAKLIKDAGIVLE
ncbi:MAG: tripartite tricarboxylate transporter substrate binding protein [Proteobacteria bacterium]|nr:tripartite tricarboxylate transporter substrate binding protein [Pseudomonadota bacterium]